jgi:hypothetical protein
MGPEGCVKAIKTMLAGLALPTDPMTVIPSRRNICLLAAAVLFGGAPAMSSLAASSSEPVQAGRKQLWAEEVRDAFNTRKSGPTSGAVAAEAGARGNRDTSADRNDGAAGSGRSGSGNQSTESRGSGGGSSGGSSSGGGGGHSGAGSGGESGKGQGDRGGDDRGGRDRDGNDHGGRGRDGNDRSGDDHGGRDRDGNDSGGGRGGGGGGRGERDR